VSISFQNLLAIFGFSEFSTLRNVSLLARGLIISTECGAVIGVMDEDGLVGVVGAELDSRMDADFRFFLSRRWITPRRDCLKMGEEEDSLDALDALDELDSVGGGEGDSGCEGTGRRSMEDVSDIVCSSMGRKMMEGMKGNAFVFGSWTKLTF
jgi:hypothetical protein